MLEPRRVAGEEDAPLRPHREQRSGLLGERARLGSPRLRERTGPLEPGFLPPPHRLPGRRDRLLPLLACDRGRRQSLAAAPERLLLARAGGSGRASRVLARRSLLGRFAPRDLPLLPCERGLPERLPLVELRQPLLLLRLLPRRPRPGGRRLRRRPLLLREGGLVDGDLALDLGPRGLLPRLAPLGERIDGDGRHRGERDEGDRDDEQRAALAAPALLALVH